jgi:hypothetical protein
MFRIVTRFSVVAALTAGLVACSTTREAKYDDVKTDNTVVNTDKVAEGDALWAERADQAKLEGAIAKWEEAAAEGADFDLYVKLSRGHYFLADGFHALAGDAEKRDAHYTAGLDWAEKAIAIAAPEFVAAVKNGEKHADAIKKAPKDAIPALYWYSTNMGKWAGAKGFATILRYKDDIKATMMHVLALDPNGEFFHGAVYRYFGAYEAKTAGLAGGSLPKSEENFKKAIEIAPNYLGTKVLYADYYCSKKQNKELFEKLLNEVIAADAGSDEAIAPENKIEQKKAKALLAEIDDKF